MNLTQVGLFLVIYLFLGEATWTRALSLGGALIVMFIGSLYFHQEKLLYQPKLYPQFTTPSQNPATYRSPEEYDMSYENIYLKASDGCRLHAWLIKCRHGKPVELKDTNQTASLKDDSISCSSGTSDSKPSASVNGSKAGTHGVDSPAPEYSRRPTILYLQENAGNMGFRLPNVKYLLDELDVNVFLLSYRGYGESEGSPSENGLIMDAEAALKYLQSRQDIDSKKIILFGRSLGGAVSIALASSHAADIQGMILENSFTSISDLVDTLFPFLRLLKPYILRLDWNSIRRIATVVTPTLFISGLQDEIVPPVHMKRLYGAAVKCQRKAFIEFEGMHNDTWLRAGRRYFLDIRKFLEQLGDSSDSTADASDSTNTTATTAASKPSSSDEPVPAVAAVAPSPLSSVD